MHTEKLSAQLLDKIRDKAEDKIVEKIFEGESSSRQNTPEAGDNSNNYHSKSSRRNTTGGGLSKAEIDVETTIASAEKSYIDKDFGRARSAVRDAIMAIELEIGENILASLPESVEGLSSNPGRDNVTSTGIGFVGLTIERVYEGPEKELTFTVANNSALYSTVNMYLAAGNYGSTNEQEYKKIDYKGYDAVIEYDDYKGYTLNVPFGQSSLVVINGINYSTEEDFMAATRSFNIEKIKSELGEK
jgi:hypothetical protein